MSYCLILYEQHKCVSIETGTSKEVRAGKKAIEHGQNVS